MGTVAGLRTRRYHGLLAVAVDGPASRMLGLVALDPVLVVGDARFRLATDEWADGTVDPRGHELLVVVRPRGRRPALALADRRHRARARARDGARPPRGRRRPPARPRRPAGASRADAALHVAERARRAVRRTAHPAVEPTADGFVFEGAYRVAGAGWEAGGEWYRDVRAREEAARGLSDREDVWAAGTLRRRPRAGQAARGDGGRRAVRRRRSRPPAEIVAAARARARELAARRAGATDAVDAQLVLAADQFAITTDGRPTAVAGYPWFGEWSRDLMTSYEGLYLATNRHDEGREVLRTSAATVSEGMLANTADTGSLEYNTVDGTLWFVHASAGTSR